jgi:hypothetical protein
MAQTLQRKTQQDAYDDANHCIEMERAVTVMPRSQFFEAHRTRLEQLEDQHFHSYNKNIHPATKRRSQKEEDADEEAKFALSTRLGTGCDEGV